MERFALHPGDLLYGMSGSIGNFGVVGPSDVPSQLNQRVGRFRIDATRLLHSYLPLIVQAPEFASQISLFATGTAQFNISPQDIERVWVTIPPLSEQASILVSISDATGPLLLHHAQLARQIDLLREYRARLVADVVTGKLDVRAAAAALPDEAPDDGEPLAPDDYYAADDDVDATDAPDEG